jgi:hypothetical protein
VSIRPLGLLAVLLLVAGCQAAGRGSDAERRGRPAASADEVLSVAERGQAAFMTRYAPIIEVNAFNAIHTPGQPERVHHQICTYCVRAGDRWCVATFDGDALVLFVVSKRQLAVPEIMRWGGNFLATDYPE